ncbi:MAG: 2-C-methyl-D-erythritol 2,4-cyclodiphosphate synthase [Clostridiales bacterium]|nr:2-C-methyl-D-erythritol 2,4-cyclodiphosphate synthase [Clostridiales bacterium]
MVKIGVGYDAHQLVPGRKLILGGVTIPHHVGLLGHSDADVLTHALIDALLGAVGLGSIGEMFPNTHPAYKDASSLELLAEVSTRLTNARINNIDATIIAQAPQLTPYIPSMRAKLGAILNTGRINIKATTTEYMGFEGREEGISAICVCIIEHNALSIRKREIFTKIPSK